MAQGIIDRFFPSTKMCPSCGVINEDITISDRIFTCGCGYTEDRDIKAAKTLLLAGEHKISCTRAGHTGTPEERKSSGSQSSIPRMRYGSILRDALRRERDRKLHPLSISEGWSSSPDNFLPSSNELLNRLQVIK